MSAVAAGALATPALGQSSGGGSAPPGGQVQQPAPPPPRTPRLVVDRPTKKVQIREGQGGRLLLGGRWYFRLDPGMSGERRRWQRQRSLAGWTAIRTPHNWNGTDTTVNRGTFGWYRKELKLPRARGTRWKLRLESVIARATVWVNGRRQKTPVGQLPYFPIEFDLKGLKRGRNRIVIRVSNRRGANDLTHWRFFGAGGWWNFGGLSREVYLRPIRRKIDIEHVAVGPVIRCRRCRASVRVRVRLRNLSGRGRRVRLALSFSGRKGRGKRRFTVEAGVGGSSTRSVRTGFTIRRPRLWQPGSPYLYNLGVAAAVDGARAASYRTRFGVKHIKRLRDGRVLLNGRRLQLRGASIHEDHRVNGAAFNKRNRSEVVRRLRGLKANVTRAHYPVHPALMEAFDRTGILYWSQAPVYQLPERNLAARGIRRSAVRANELTVERDFNHASVLTWSIANELPNESGRGSQAFIREATRAVRRLDRTRMVAIDRQSRLDQPDPVPAIQRLDAIGINEYFGWYGASLRPDPRRPGRYLPSKTSDLGPFLDRTYQLYGRKPLFITEFGAESNRDGSASEKGTYQFQTAWMLEHLRIHASRPFVNGSMAWILKDFRVHPTWGGGNPKPNPPWNNKGLIDESGAFKPAFWKVREYYAATRRPR